MSTHGIPTKGVQTLRSVSIALAVLCLFGPAGSRAATTEGEARERAGQSAAATPREVRTGRWRPARDRGQPAELNEEQRREIEKLSSIGYLGGSRPAPAASGVTIYDRSRAYSGLNFYSSGHFPGAILMDMEGAVLHEWSYGFLDAWPERLDLHSHEYTGHWRRAYLFENGDVLAIFEGRGIVKIDKDSNLLWKQLNGAHHDLEVMDDGRIYVLTREAHVVPRLSATEPVLEDYIAILDADGQELTRVSVLESFERSTYAMAIAACGMIRFGDITHTNTVEVLDGRLAHRIPAFRAGNVLISLRKVHVIAVVDMDLRQVEWALGGMWLGQHQPTVLDNGNILVFDNGRTDMSRVVEFDPATQEVAWSYEGDESDVFYTKSAGSNQRLPNGNTLITESDPGRALEVAQDGSTVWEYVNPERTGRDDYLIATLFELIRLPPDFPIDWLPGN